MDLRHSVDSVRSYNGQVRHVDPLSVILLHQRHTPQAVPVSRVPSSHILQQIISTIPNDSVINLHYGRVTSKWQWLM